MRPHGNGATARRLQDDTTLVAQLYNAVHAAAGSDGWASFNLFCNRLLQRNDGFDPRDHGFPRVGGLVHACELFEFRRDNQEGPRIPGGEFWLRAKDPEAMAAVVQAWPVGLLDQAVAAVSGPDGWADLGAVGHHLKSSADFDASNYGFRRLSQLLQVTGHFDIHTDGTARVRARVS